MEVTGGILAKFIVCLIWINLAVVSTQSETQNYCVDYGYTPANGTRRPPPSSGNMFSVGAVIRYFCNENFELEPYEPTQVCTLSSDKKFLYWVPSYQPICAAVGTCPTPVIGHGTPTKNSYHHGDYLYVTCDEGYEKHAQVNQSICLDTGKWSSVPTCTEKPCNDPPAIADGYCHMVNVLFLSYDGWPHGTEVACTCNNGYVLEPSSQYQRFCSEGQWSGSDPQCVSKGCQPPDDVDYGTYYPQKSQYDVGETVTYMCYLNGEVSRTCQEDHTWSGGTNPCMGALSTEPMPYTADGNVYCLTPLPINHGSVLCCSDSEVTANTTEDPNYCCPVHGVVQFVCDAGYVIEQQATQWKCGPHGQWMFVNPPEHGQPSSSPVCYSNTTRQENSPASDDMLKPVLGTAAGVLFILSAAIIIAFCRPKLKDIKRRWREQREDEDELIIDGRRILLPSYEEAMSSPHDPNYLQLARPSTSGCHNNMPGPSYTNVYVEDNPGQEDTPRRRSSSRDDVSLILQMHPEPPPVRRHPRNASSSDEEMLVPGSERASMTLKNTVADNLSSQDEPQLPLILSAGVSADSSIVINKVPVSMEQMPECDSFSKDSTSFLPQHDTPSLEIPGTTVNEPTIRTDTEHDNMNNFMHFTTAESFSDTEGSFSIQPRNMVTYDDRAVQLAPVISREVHALLTYPLALAESETNECSGTEKQNLTFTIQLENGDEREAATETMSNSQLDTKDIIADKEKDSVDKEEQIHDTSSHARSDDVYLVTSSHSAEDGQLDDLTGSTTV